MIPEQTIEFLDNVVQKGKPMTKSLERLIEMTAIKMAEVKPGEVCSKCRDDRICEECPFHTPSTFHRNL